MDITRLKRAEDLFFNLSQMLMQAQKRERQMISRELHDSIAQNLSSLKIGCDMIFDDQPAIPHEVRIKTVRNLCCVVPLKLIPEGHYQFHIIGSSSNASVTVFPISLTAAISSSDR